MLNHFSRLYNRSEMPQMILLLNTVILLLVLSLSYTTVTGQESNTVFNDGFENGWGNWWVDNGVWDIGTPTVGPDTCHSGSNCAGTVLNGNYPDNANTRLISPSIKLPNLGSNEKLRLQFWYWFQLFESVHGNDQGWIQVSVNGGNWKTVYGPFSGISSAWTQVYVDLSSYADSTIRIAFYMTSDWIYTDNGWYIDDIRIEGLATDIDNPSWESKVIKSFALYQIYPNPFNPATTIRFVLPKPSYVTLKIYNLHGEEIETLVRGERPAGEYEVKWNAKNLTSGIYFYRLQAGGKVETKRLVLVK
jgi:hypothetical protein